MSVAKFNVIDGVDGAGKSLQLNQIDWLLKSLGMEGRYVRTREPGGTAIAEEIRHVLVRSRDENEEQMTVTTENSLFWAARAQHVEALIRPKLSAGTHVFSDRFYDATYAYQGAGRGISPELIDKYRELAIGDFKPDNVAIFDADLDVLKARINARGQKNRFDDEEAEFYARARDIFLSRAQDDPERYSIIDAAFHPAHVLGQMIGWLERCGIISLNDSSEQDMVVNAAMNVYWDDWSRFYDAVDVAPQLLAGLAHFRSHRDPRQQRPGHVVHLNGETVV